MRHCYFKGTLLATALLFVAGCIKDSYAPVTEVQNNEILSVEKARRFFEDEITRSAGVQGNRMGIFVPADFTPIWQKAVTSSEGSIASVDVPIIASHSYRVMRSEFQAGKARAYTVDVSTKLVVVKDTKTGSIAQYVMSIIPDEDYAKKNKGDLSLKVINTGSKGRFSGMVIYSDIVSGIPVTVNRFEDEIKVFDASVYGEGEFKEKIARVATSLKDIRVQSKKNTMTRFGEDDWWYYGDDDCGACCGGGGGCVFCNPDLPHCPICGGMGCHLCGGIDNPWPFDGNTSDPGDPDPGDPGWGEGSGLWWIKCSGCHSYLGNVVTGQTKYFYCSNCGIEFYAIGGK